MAISYIVASIGLLAFATLMWMTLPLAFVDRIDAMTKHLRREYGWKFSEYELRTPKRLLGASATVFAWSGFFFVGEVIAETASAQIPQLSNLLPILFWVGCLFLVVAMYNAYRAVDFAIYGKLPIWELPIGSRTSEIIDSLTNAVPHVAMILTNALFLALLLIFLQYLNLVGHVFLVLEIASTIAVLLSYKYYHGKELNRKAIPLFLIIFLPYIFLILEIIRI